MGTNLAAGSFKAASIEPDQTTETLHACSLTAEQVRGAPAFYGDEMVWPDRERENKARDYWRLPPS